MSAYQPKTGHPCHCRRGQQRDNCPDCEGTGQRINFAVIRARILPAPNGPLRTFAQLLAKAHQ